MFRGGVVSQTWHGLDTTHRRIVEEQTSGRLILLPEEPNGFSADISSTPEVGVEDLASLLFWVCLSFSNSGPPGIVEDHIDASEYLPGLCESIFDF